MKKSILLFGAVAMITFASCKKEVTTSDTNVEPASDTTVIIKEDAPAPAPDTVVKTETDGTSVSVSSDGVNVSSKSGDKKTTVDVDAKK